MSDRLEVFNLQHEKTAILQNAFNVVEKQSLNGVYSLRFSLPDTDPKVDYCKTLHYVRYGNGQLYRILAPKRTRGATGIFTYECEHVIATLIDDVMFGSYTYGNVGRYTADTINYILGKQSTRRWSLNACDFSRQFEYGWENENLLAALMSIPQQFADKYKWTYDTSSYPWRVSLMKIDESAEPEFYVRAGKNFLASEDDDDASEICTRLYCLGYGEGVNQLTIKSVNNGLPYLQSPQSYVSRYGIISRIWTDRRFEDAESLKARGEALLAEYQEPRMCRTVSAADLSRLTNDDFDRAEIGKIVMLTDDNTKTYITAVERSLDTDEVTSIDISNKPADIAQDMADLADRQRIEQVYAQGATNLYGQSVQANASNSKGAFLNFYVPDEMRIVNAVKAKITLDAFRSYSRATGGGGAGTQTSSSGGESTATSSSGGGTSTSTQSGGGTATSTSSGGGTATSTSSGGGTSTTSSSSSATTTNANGAYSGSLKTGGASVQDYSGFYAQTGVQDSHTHGTRNHWHAISINIGSHSHGMSHTHGFTVPAHTHGFTVPAHTHGFTVPAHTHGFTIPDHSHTVTIPAHTHSVTIPNHTHEIEQGIFEFGNPTGASVYVNGAFAVSMSADAEIDITQYLASNDGTIPRGSWLNVEVRPNDLAYITIDLFVQGFVQSRGGGTY